MYRKRMREALEEARAYRDPVNEDRGFSSKQIKMAYGVLNDPRYKQGNYSGAVRAIEKIARGLSNHPDVANALKRANEELEEASKYLRYSDLLIQKGRMQRAGDKQGERLTDIEIEKEKKKLGIKEDLNQDESISMGGKFIVRFKRGDQKPVQAIFDTKAQADAYEKEKRRMGFEIVEDLNQDDEKVIKKVKDMLKGASAKHAAQAKMIDKALKDEAFTKKDFDKNEDENDHTLNAVMLAKEFGSSKEIKDMEDIDKRHRQRGHINEPDYSKRNAIVKKYYPRLK